MIGGRRVECADVKKDRRAKAYIASAQTSTEPGRKTLTLGENPRGAALDLASCQQILVLLHGQSAISRLCRGLT
eukprot:6180762-Pleurochrysis_carterae.AAC.3